MDQDAFLQTFLEDENLMVFNNISLCGVTTEQVSTVFLLTVLTMFIVSISFAIIQLIPSACFQSYVVFIGRCETLSETVAKLERLLRFSTSVMT